MAAVETDVKVTASELSEYVYCKRAWWLRQKGALATQAMVDGLEEHESIFLRLQSLRIRKYIAWGFLIIGALIMVYIIVLQLWQ